MRDDRGQASVEWIALVLLLTLALAALVRFAPRADAGGLGPELLHAIACAARGGCQVPDGGESGARPGEPPHGMVSAPPLVPVAPREPRALSRPGAPAPPVSRWRPVRLFRGRVLRRASSRSAGPGRRAAVLWRRSWLLCLGYERARYGFLHPEVRFPHVPIPLSEDLRMVNDCLSPVDLVRDWDLIRGPR